MNEERNTHFRDFASHLWVEIVQSSEWGEAIGYSRSFTREQVEPILILIAQRVYDLVERETMSRSKEEEEEEEEEEL